MSMQRITITADNIESVREQMQSATDQADEIQPGCETWGITYAGGQRGQMSRWPGGRGAVCWGGDSQWGDWVQHPDHGTVLYLDDTDGILVTEDGEEITAEDDD